MPMTTAKHTDTLFRFTDSDYVMSPDTRSVSDAFSLLAGCPGARGSNPVSPSAYGGSTEVASEAIWLRQFMRDLTQD